eukprot:CAMPEP_0184499456 /NCGR_PEP_ID=MMETSP0113_2-20130426/41556_1 /TAXON_ID=91329 /ORGANISM="Norrisiella sphaerica, Strain BC52" /LENGTH=531 /DNA_ID=CAMNT_0026887371 /DNA_START=6 /DNA_END=1601 /DNA_ORIENTATION=+
MPESKREHEIVHMTATQLREKLASGEITAVETTIAFCRAAYNLQKDLDCLAEINFEDAIAEARKLDEERKEGKLRGILHGVPVSIKDQIAMNGFDSTCGLSARCFKPENMDSVLVKIIKKHGGIPFVRTNVPQALFLSESVNCIWGQCKNPFNLSRTSGGSSGGEAALISARGSPLGIGTDIGGSIRGPSLYCGITGFKPTPTRLSYKGIAVPRPQGVSGQAVIKATAGPMARCVDDLELAMRVFHSDKRMHQMDSNVPPTEWNHALYVSEAKLKFGYFVDDGYFDNCKASRRAVRETVEKLKKAGHTVVELEFKFQEIAWSYIKLMSAEGGMKGFIDALEGEELNPIYLFLYKTANIPLWLRPVISGALNLLGQTRIAKLVSEARWRDTYDYWAQHAKLLLQKKALTKKWEELKLDALLCPSVGVPAVPHGMSSKLAQSYSYNFIWNAVHFPAGVVPTTLVKSDEEDYEGRKDSITAAAQVAAIGSSGLPMGVQVVALPWRDELCLKAMKAVEAAVGWEIPIPPLSRTNV